MLSNLKKKERQKNVKVLFSLFLFWTAIQLVSKFTFGLHSTVRKVPTRHKDSDKASVGILLSPELLLEYATIIIKGMKKKLHEIKLKPCKKY